MNLMKHSFNQKISNFNSYCGTFDIKNKQLSIDGLSLYVVHMEGVNNFVSLVFLFGRFLSTVLYRKPSIYKGSWALPTPGLWNKMEVQRHKIKNTTNQNDPFGNVSVVIR